SAPGTQAITMLAATVLRTNDAASVAEVLARLADGARPRWQQVALIAGAEVAVVNAPPPGTPTPARGRGAAVEEPCPTCPGGRGGPGGARAIPDPPSVAATRGRAATPGPAAPAGGGRGCGRGGRGGGPMLRLTSEPVAV